MFIQGAAGIHPPSRRILSPTLFNRASYYNCTRLKNEPLVPKVSPLEGPFSSRLLLFWLHILFLFILKIVSLCWQHLFLKFLVWLASLQWVEQHWSLLTTLNSCSFASKQEKNEDKFKYKHSCIAVECLLIHWQQSRTPREPGGWWLLYQKINRDSLTAQ
jgi:hypothetical protein